MKQVHTQLIRGITGLALAILAASSALAGQNAGAHCKLSWGDSFNSTQTDVSTTPGSTVTLWLSVVGLVKFRGADVQVIVSGDEGYYNGAPLASAWQFQRREELPCPDNMDNLEVSSGSAFVGVGNVATTFNHMYRGDAPFATAFDKLWFLWYSSAGAAGAIKDPSTRYGIVKYVFTLPGADCPGAGSAVCFGPQLRPGYGGTPGYGNPVVAILGDTDALDYVPFDPGFGHLTANYSGPGVHGCPAPTAARASTWGSLRHLYR